MTGTPMTPMDFVASALGADGALLERDGDTALAVLDPEVAGRLGVPAEARLSPDGRDGSVACGMGSALLEKLVGAARGRVPLTVGKVPLPAPRAAQAESLAGRFVVRNGLSHVGGVLVGTAWYAALVVQYRADADERHEGVVTVAWALDDARSPASDAAEGWLGQDLATATTPPPVVAPDPLAWLPGVVEARVAAQTGMAHAGALRRHQRDHQRVARYYGELTEEARSSRRKVDAAARAQKVLHLENERAVKLAELAERFTWRVSVQPAALVLVEVACARVNVSVQRRSARAQLVLHLPAGAGALDEPRCHGCWRTAPAPVLCDDALHLLCHVCAPAAAGRPDCPACRTRAPGLVVR